MAKKLVAAIKLPKEIFGSEKYLLNLSITNVTNKTINIMSVETQSILGNIKNKDTLIGRDDSDISEYDRLNANKQRIIQEMNKIIYKSYNRRLEKYRNGFMYYNSNDYIETYDALQAISIENWRDVGRLEKEFITNNPNNDVKRIFYLNKEKLSEIMTQQSEIECNESKTEKETFKTKYVVQPGETITFPFEVLAPFLSRSKNFTFQFKIAYQDPINGSITNFSISEDSTFYPSIFSIYLGCVFGALVGYTAKIALIAGSSNIYFNIYNCFGTIALSLIFTAFTVRTPHSKKVITTEDFIGGFILGALTGIASDTIHGYLLKFLPGTK